MAAKSTVDLPIGAVEATAPAWLALVDQTATTDRPRVLRVRVEALGVMGEGGDPEPLIPPSQHQLSAGAWWNITDGSADPWTYRDHGLLEIVCGDAGDALRTIYADLRGGEYQLPPCKQVTVRAGRYYAGTAPAVAPELYRVTAQLVEGYAGDYTPLQFTAVRRMELVEDGGEIVGGYHDLQAPPGAYAFELYPDGGIVHEGNHGLQRNRLGAVQDPPASPIPLATSALYLNARVNEAGDAAGSLEVKAIFFVR